MTREHSFNCWLFAFCLIARGKLRAISFHGAGPLPHAVGITRRGNLIHFQRSRGRPVTCSLWFPGEVWMLPAAWAGELARKRFSIKIPA